MRLGLRTSATAATPAFLARGSACECNAHYRQQVERGARHLLVGVDRPTGLGHDSDDPAARGAVGQAGAAIDSVDDMRVLLRGLALDRVTATLLVDLPGAAPLASLWCLVMEERAGGARCRLRIALRPPDPARMPGLPAERYAERLTALLHAVCAPAGVPVRPAGPHDPDDRGRPGRAPGQAAGLALRGPAGRGPHRAADLGRPPRGRPHPGRAACRPRRRRHPRGGLRRPARRLGSAAAHPGVSHGQVPGWSWKAITRGRESPVRVACWPARRGKDPPQVGRTILCQSITLEAEATKAGHGGVK